MYYTTNYNIENLFLADYRSDNIPNTSDLFTKHVQYYDACNGIEN